MPSADCASIGWTGVSTDRWKRANARLPPLIAAFDAAPRSPESIAARRTSGAGTPAARDGVDHHALERSLADLAHQQPEQERPLRLGGLREQVLELGARRLRAGAREAADPSQRRIHFDQLERRLR